MKDIVEAYSVVVTVRMQPAMIRKLLAVAGPHGTLSRVVRALLAKAIK